MYQKREVFKNYKSYFYIYPVVYEKLQYRKILTQL